MTHFDRYAVARRAVAREFGEAAWTDRDSFEVAALIRWTDRELLRGPVFDQARSLLAMTERDPLPRFRLRLVDP